MVMGPVGSGKSLLCQLLASQFRGELPVCIISSGRLRTREVLLQQIVHGLGLPYHGLSEGDLRLTLGHHVEGQSCVKGILLIVDEAERLPLDLLEEIRALTNLAKEGQPSVRLVLVGTHRLEERVSSPKLESLNQRIVGRLFVDNFTREETSDYIRARIGASGGDATKIFAEEAFGTVYDATNGVPRLINQICDHAMLMAAINGVKQITSRGIEAAWADLQQIPMPIGDTVEVTQGTSTVIEFGSLDEFEDRSSQTLEVIDQMEVEIELPADEISETVESRTAAFDPRAESIATDESFTPQPQDYDLDVFRSTGKSEYRMRPLHDIELRESPPGEGPGFVDDSRLTIDAMTTEAGFDPKDHVSARPIEFSISESDEPSTSDAEMIVTYATDASMDESTVDSANEGPETERDTFGNDADTSNSDQHIAADTVVAVESEGDDQTVTDWPMEHDPEPEYRLAAETEATAQDSFTATNTPTRQPEPEPELATEFATNPFDEAFDEEEIVIQQFASPSQLARGERDNVSSAYSQHLATQLRAAHPGLRMHDASNDGDEQSKLSSTAKDVNEFRRLSAFYEDDDSIDAFVDEQQVMDTTPAASANDRVPIEDGRFEGQDELTSTEYMDAIDNDTYETELPFDPASDPVMPEDSIAALGTNISADPLTDSELATANPYLEEVDAVTDLSDIDLFDSLADSDDETETSIASSISDIRQAVQQDIDASQSSNDELLRTEEPHALQKHARTHKTEKRRFRTLFSGMRRI